MPLRFCACAGALALLLVIPSGAAEAQRAAHGPPDWPCVQRLIPELGAGSIWAGPPIDELDMEWWEDEEVARVVRFATARETPVTEALERVNAFIETVEEDELETRLTLLFAGLFREINQERSRTIEAVRRYARGQVGRLERISGLVDELEQLRGSNGAEPAAIERLEQELFWERRLFHDRQTAMRALCSQPYILEERLGRFVGTIHARL